MGPRQAVEHRNALGQVEAAHPQPVFFSKEGSFPPDWSRAFGINMLAIFLLYAALTMIRLRQEQTQREIDYLRRTVHAM